MTLPGAPTTYEQFLKDVTTAVWNAPTGLPGNLSRMDAVVVNTQQLTAHIRDGVNGIIGGVNRIIRKIGA